MRNFNKIALSQLAVIAMLALLPPGSPADPLKYIDQNYLQQAIRELGER